MQTIPTIQEVKDRANKLGIPMKVLCERANIANSTFTRWQSGKSDWKMGTYLRLIKALEAVESTSKKYE